MLTLSAVRRYLDWFVPPSLRQDADTLQRARMFVIGHLFGTPLGLLLAAYFYVLDPAPGLHWWIIAGANSAFFGLAWALRLTGRLTLLSYISVQNLVFVILFGSYHYGGASSPVLSWLPTVPLVTLFYLGSRSWLRASVLGCVALYLGAYYGIHATGHPFPEHVPLAALSEAGIASVFCATVFVSMMSLYYANIVASTTELKAARDRAEQERERAEAANRAKSDFLASMSHELRTPLNAVLGFAQLLEFSSKEPVTPKQARHVAQIKKAGTHLLSLINDVLDLAKVENGNVRLSIECVPLGPVLEQLRATLLPLAEEADVRLTVQVADGLAVFADRTRLVQILMNLGTNAIKYNRTDGTAALLAEPAGPERVRLSMVDTGIGIPLDRQPELFQPFNRLGADRGAIEGTGIGLTITQRLVDLMDGKLSFRSVPGEGSTFTVELPAAPVQPAQRPDSEGAATAVSRQGGYTLLYVEDNPSNIHLMQSLVESLPGVRLLVASRAETGIELARAHGPDVIVLDINLPGMSGYGALRELKSMPRTARIPVMALSAAATPREIERGRAAGFTHYLTKPINIAHFLAAIEAVLAERV